MMGSGTLAILCGGESKRLGTDKGLYCPLSDESLIGRAIRLFGAGFDELLVIVGTREQKEAYEAHIATSVAASLAGKVRVVRDRRDDPSAPRAALCGVITALDASHDPTVTVIPVDQVGVRIQALRRLCNEAAAHSGRPYHFEAQGAGPLPFPSVWPRETLGTLHRLAAEGRYSVKAALRVCHAVAIDAGEMGSELVVNGNSTKELVNYFGEALHDEFGRRLHYLRFSLTEACNMSCTYCLPEGFPEWYRHKARLSEGDIDVVLGGFRRLGFRKVRFTGGEPTVHPRCLDAVRRARRLGYESICLTTNGLLLKNLAEWVEAGLDQINVSLDSLDPTTFERITKARDHAGVLALIDQAIDLGIEVKINTVLMRSVNASETASLIDWALERPLTLRFIELMPTGLNRAFHQAERVLGSEIAPLLHARGLAASDENSNFLRGPATVYGSRDRRGRIGLINPLSCNFCAACNRLRVTARGAIKLCLFGNDDIPLDLSSPAAMASQIRTLIGRKPERHRLEEGDSGNVATFRTIGG